MPYLSARCSISLRSSSSSLSVCQQFNLSLLYETSPALPAVSELGLVSQQLHKYGNSYLHYASKQYKHGLGLLLFSVIASLLVTLSHPWLSVACTSLPSLPSNRILIKSFVNFIVISFSSFVMAVFFGTGAGIIQRTAPFTGHGCARKPLADYPQEWQPYVGECSRVVAIQGIAWALCKFESFSGDIALLNIFAGGLYIFLMLGTIIHKVKFVTRATPEGFYASKV